VAGAQKDAENVVKPNNPQNQPGTNTRRPPRRGKGVGQKKVEKLKTQKKEYGGRERGVHVTRLKAI